MHLNRESVERAMLAKEYTQKMLAEESGLSAYSVSNILRGASCKMSSAIRIADALGATLDSIKEK